MCLWFPAGECEQNTLPASPAVFLPQAAENCWKADAEKRALFIASYSEFRAHCVAPEGCA